MEAASTHDPAPSQPASAGTQSPVTLQVKTPPKKSDRSHGQVAIQVGVEDEAPAGMDKVRLFAHPGNPDARAAAIASAARKARHSNAGQRLPLRSGSVVSSGTVLGHVSVPPGARDGHLRFAIRPAGDADTIDPGPILANWAQLQTALHPRGAKATDALLGATASDVLLLSRTQLERTVLSDPGISLAACAHDEVASGHVDRRVLAVLAYLSRSGLKPTVSALGCSQSGSTAADAATAGEHVDISAINDTPIAGHQGPGTITDLTIRALLTLPGEFVPNRIVSLMRYPGSSNTHADSSYANRIHLAFPDGHGQRQAQPGGSRHGGSLGELRPDRAGAARHDQHAEHGPVEPADRTRRGAADADGRHQAELLGDPRPEAPLALAPAVGPHRPRAKRPSTRPSGRLTPTAVRGRWSWARRNATSRDALWRGPMRYGRGGSGPRSRRASPGLCAQRALEEAAALGLGGLELRAARVQAFAAEDRTTARGVGRGDVHAVFAHAARELRKRLLGCRAPEQASATGEASGPDPEAALLQDRLVLGLCHPLRQVQARDASTGRRPLAGLGPLRQA